MSNLDRALCEKLGIAPIDESPGHMYARHDGTSDCQNGCGAWMGPFRSGAPTGVDPFGECPLAAPVYPPLSTTGDGMLLLMKELLADDWGPTITAWCLASHPSIDRTHWYVTVQNPLDGKFTARHHASAPMALALAAAAALGIEVQP